MINRRHFDALIAIELKRTWKTLRLVLVMGIVAVVVLVATGKVTRFNLLALVLGGGLAPTIGAAATMLRDKMERTLEFLSTLPTEPSTIAAAKFCAIAVTALPWALVGAFVLVGSDLGGLPFASTELAWLSAAAAIWGSYLFLAWGLLALWTRFEPEQIGIFPIVILMILAFGGDLLLDLLDPKRITAALEWLSTTPWAPAATAAAVLVAAAALGALAFQVMVSGIRTYRPRPAEL